MPIELESGNLLLTAEERERFAPAAAWHAEESGRPISLADPLSLAEFADLVIALCVVEGDSEGLAQIQELTAEALRRRESPQ